MAGRLIDGYLKDLEYRRTVRNWPADVQAIVDGYRAYSTISHAVQKDAIQNAWSARCNKKKGTGWSFVFELLETPKHTFLLMTDEGTTGLTGRVLKPEEYELDLPGEERWGRFEGVAFTQPREERTLGSRGRGKFIFVGASEEHTIFYDTLRGDRTYRFGFRTVSKTESPIAAYDDQDGRQKLIEWSSNTIQPLSRVGTRVIIVNPISELVKDVKNGEFLRHICETWWELILKFDAAIKVKIGRTEQSATIPADFELKDQDSRQCKTWIKKDQKIRAGLGEVKIKNLHICYNQDRSVPENIRGVAIQREGMKICAIHATYLPREIAEGLYGYINFDAETEEMLLEDEGIEHYYYDFRKSYPGAIKRFIDDEILRLAREKLGYGLNAREVRRQQQRNAERRALAAANNFARALGIGVGPGVDRKKKRSKKEIEWKKVWIHLEDLLFPRSSDIRINYGEALKNIGILVVNNDERKIEIRVKLFLRYYDKVVRTYAEQDIVVSKHSNSEVFGPWEEQFTVERFPDKGKYTLVAKILSLMEIDKGTELDYKTKSFYLEEDPPMKGLFERCEAYGSPDEEPIKYWMGYSEFGSESGLVLYYSVNHPGYASVSESEEDLAEYIIRIAAQEICRFDLMQDEPILFSEEQQSDAQEVLKQERRIIGELVYKFRKGEV